MPYRNWFGHSHFHNKNRSKNVNSTRTLITDDFILLHWIFTRKTMLSFNNILGNIVLGFIKLHNVFYQQKSISTNHLFPSTRIYSTRYYIQYYIILNTNSLWYSIPCWILCRTCCEQRGKVPEEINFNISIRYAFIL